LLPRANAAACPQLAKADFASSSQHAREAQRIAELEAKIDALQRQALALGAEPTAVLSTWVLLGVKIAARRERALRRPNGRNILLNAARSFLWCCRVRARELQSTPWR
jgi:hypothetical protein